jgi:1-acyl-sn-glycerol-3-phosphate acyltransferase
MTRALLIGCIRLLTGATSRWLAPPSLNSQCIYFANHTSHLDAVVLWAALPGLLRDQTRPVAAKDYWDKSALRRYLATHVFHAILIDRTKVTVQNNPIKLMVHAMGDSSSLIIFPEGKRGEGEDVGEFKSGLFHLVKEKPNVTLVPVFIENLNRVLPKGEFLPVPLLSSITFGAPLPVIPSETKTVFLDRARHALCELKPHT